MFFAKNLKYLREKYGMDQLELAKRLGKKSRSSVSEWEKGSYTPKMGTLRTISDIFDVPIDDLMETDLQNGDNMPRKKVDNETLQVRQEIAKNLKALARGMTQAEFAEKVGIPLTTISGYMTAKSTIKPGNTQKIADAFNLRKSDIDPRFRDKESILQDKKGTHKITSIYAKLNDTNKNKVIDYSEQLLDEQEHPRDAVKEVPFVGYSAAGTDAEPYCADTTGECAQTNKLDADAFVILTGDSMEPRFHQGEPVFYRSQSDIENGEFAIVEIDGEGAICKQVKMDYKNRKVILHSLNPKYEDIVMDPKRIRILGKVIE